MFRCSNLLALAVLVTSCCCWPGASQENPKLIAHTFEAGRALQQSAGQATACADGCSTAPGACVLQRPTGNSSSTGAYVCLKCEGSRVLASDGTCGCAPGSYLTPQGRCSACPAGSWCPGGTAADSAAVPCSKAGKGLSTTKPGAVSFEQCVNMPGYSYDATSGSAVPCRANSYCEGWSRQPACTPCPGDLRTQPGSRASSHSSPAACMVPPGWRLAGSGSSQAERCAGGEFREGYAAATAAAALKCKKCAKGSTTLGSRGGSRKQDCKLLLPGWYWAVPKQKSSSSAKAAPMQAAEPLPRLCPQNSWCSGGVVGATSSPNQCPDDLWTKGMGATSSSDCLVPPGHYRTATNAGDYTVEKCSNGDVQQGEPGTYQPLWLARDDAAATSCRSCGAGILSADAEPLTTYSSDENTYGAVLLMSVPRTASSCYIRQGQAMELDTEAGGTEANPVYKAVTCDSNSVGVPDTLYGLQQWPCEACLQGMVTHEVYRSSITGGFYDARACLVPPGYGVYGEEVVRCPKGEYSEGYNPQREQCTACSPEGVTTPRDASSTENDCSCVLPGYGQSNQRGVVQCPVGTYSDSERCANDKACTDCPNKKTTSEEGATAAESCNLCPPGSGTGSDAVVPVGGSINNCNPCASGFYGSPQRIEGSTTCRACPQQAPLFFLMLTATNMYVPSAISNEGAQSEQECLPAFSAADDGAWMLPATSGLVNVTALDASVDTLEECVDACKEASAVAQLSGCQFISFNYRTKQCFLRPATLSSTSSTRIAFKVNAGDQAPQPPSRTQRAAAAARPQSSSSGVFSWWRDSTAGGVGIRMRVAVASPTTSKCLQLCSESRECAAVVFQLDSAGAISNCWLRRGDAPTGNGMRTLLRTRLSRVDAL